jgi:PAS domain S-box-containing protein
MRVGVHESNRSTDASLFDNAGSMTDLYRSIDWSRTPLGPVSQWPQSLKTCVRIVLTSSQPMFVWWGDHLINLHNEAYRSILGGKHPRALGQPASVVWREIWRDVGPRAEATMRGNVGTYDEALLLIMERNGYPEETYYTFSYSPVSNDQGGTGGLICANTDDTQKIVGARQVALLRELGAQTANSLTIERACVRSAQALGTNTRDLPFGLIYLLDSRRSRLDLVGRSGFTESHARPQETVFLDGDDPWSLAEVVRLNERRLIAPIPESLGPLPTGAWTCPPRAALALPIAGSGEAACSGALVVGLNPFRKLDDDYLGFLALATSQIAAAITTGRGFEEEKKRAEALAEIDRAKTAFFSNVSHEFRTPLTLMLSPLQETLSEKRPLPIEDAALVHRNGLRLLKLVNSLLDFSRIEAGRLQASYEPVDLGALTTDLVSSFRSAIEKAGMRLVVTTPRLSEPVYVDRDMWEKIVLNLLSNAFKFTLSGEIAVSVGETSEAVELMVRDTGIGIPQQELPHIFERFHRVEGAKGRTQEGTGIGLALTHELVKLHKGTVRVESELGRGSAFTVTILKGKDHLPQDRVRAERTLASTALRADSYVEEALRWLPEGAERPSEPATESASGPFVSLEKRTQAARVLLADDNADMRDYVRRLLSQHYQVQAVADGEAALAAVRETSPDLVLTDVMMPRLDGFGLLRELRSDPRTRTIPVILLSARAGEEARVEGLDAGADDYLNKPFSSPELLGRVASHLERAARAKENERVQRAARTRAEDALHQTQETLQLLVEQVRDYAIFALDTEGRIATWNIGAERLKGYRADEIIGKHFSIFYPEERVKAGFPKEALRLAARDGRFEDEGVRVRKDGTQFIANVVITALRNPDGTLRGFAKVTRDVTERFTKAEKAQRESEERLRLACETAGLGIFEWHVPTDPALWENDRLFEIFGRTREEGPLSKAEFFEKVLHRDDKASFERALTEAMKPGRRFEEACRIWRKEGELRWIQYSARFDLSQDGQPLRLVGVVKDITDEKRVQQALKDADRRKDEFLAMLAHELRNPLAPITTALHLVRARAGERDDIARPLAVMSRQTQHLSRLVDDLLEVSRITSGKIRLELETLDASVAVTRAVEISRPLIDSKKHDLQVSVPHEPLWIDADLTRLAQVLGNLLNNAAKYTDEHGRISVTVEREGKHAVFRVKDNGIGIPKELIPRLFELFTQADTSLDRSQGGLGIGLTLVRGLVELHEGTVEALSDGAGLGSVFVVRLPLVAKPKAKDHTGSFGPPRKTVPHRIVVVDDNLDAAECLAEFLTDAGHEVKVAYDGPSALEAIRAHEPDVVFLDIGLPRLDGYEVARQLRREHGDEMTLVALTGYGQEEDRRRTKEAGFDHHLVKPVHLDALSKLLAK